MIGTTCWISWGAVTGHLAEVAILMVMGSCNFLLKNRPRSLTEERRVQRLGKLSYFPRFECAI